MFSLESWVQSAWLVSVSFSLAVHTQDGECSSSCCGNGKQHWGEQLQHDRVHRMGLWLPGRQSYQTEAEKHPLPATGQKGSIQLNRIKCWKRETWPTRGSFAPQFRIHDVPSGDPSFLFSHSARWIWRRRVERDTRLICQHQKKWFYTLCVF